MNIYEIVMFLYSCTTLLFTAQKVTLSVWSNIELEPDTSFSLRKSAYFKPSYYVVLRRCWQKGIPVFCVLLVNMNNLKPQSFKQTLKIQVRGSVLI
jgi:hypothetical protein